MNIPNDYFYSKSHEWIKFLDDTTALIGITDFAQSELGDIVFVNLPEVEDTIEVEDSFADVESVKAVSDIYSPVAGTVSKINEELLDSPELINESPYDAWLIEVSDITEKDDLLTAEEYEAFLSEEA